MIKVALHFTTTAGIALYSLSCEHRGTTYLSIRGRGGRCSDGANSFRWTKGVRAISELFLLTILSKHYSDREPRIVGGGGSCAAALDSALSSHPEWLNCMFGTMANGEPLSKRVFLRSNPGRKRPGPVAIALSPRISMSEVTIFVDGQQVVNPQDIAKMVRRIEAEHGALESDDIVLLDAI